MDTSKFIMYICIQCSKTFILYVPVWSYIKKNGKVNDWRGEWFFPMYHYYGNAHKNLIMEQSFHIFILLHYNGEKKGYPFDKFITKISECFKTHR